MRIARVTLAGLSLVLMAGACSFSIGAPQSSTSSKSTSASSNPSPKTDSSPASSPDSSGASITNVRLAKDFTYGDVVNPTSSFYPGDRQFHLVVDLGNAAECHAAGADTFVAGSAIFGARNEDGGFRSVIGAMRRELAAATAAGLAA